MRIIFMPRFGFLTGKEIFFTKTVSRGVEQSAWQITCVADYVPLHALWHLTRRMP